MADYPQILMEGSLTREERKCTCNQIMIAESRMKQLVLKHFTDDDFRHVWDRKISGNVVGGKACGLLVVRRLIELMMMDYTACMEPHDSFFIDTDVFYRYPVLSRCFELKAQRRLEKGDFKETGKLTNKLQNGHLPDDMLKELEEMLDHYESTPIIVRSSSIMEDEYGDAFSGKYESVFCMNQDTKEDRLEELECAVRRAHADVMNEQTIEYRRKRHLLNVDEQMASLIRPVAEQAYGDFYLSVTVGMGCSYNPCKWMEQLNPKTGMPRMVMGLGTRVVERVPGDYPRLVYLDRTRANLRITMTERHRFSQRQVDVLDSIAGRLCTKPLEQIIELLPKQQGEMVLSHDTEAEDMLAQRHIYREVYFVDCQGLMDNLDFIHMIRDLIKMLEVAYERPVDVEFAITNPEEGVQRLNLLQCRPLQAALSGQVHIPEDVDHQLSFDMRRTSMRRSKEETTDYIVWVDPRRYYEYPYAKRPDVARLVSRINQHFEGADKKLVLLVPGRIGTSSPELGIPVICSEISRFNAVCEVAYDKIDCHPNLSYGSHIFQDVVEADVYYGAIDDSSKTRLYQPGLLARCPEILKELWLQEEGLADIVRLYDVSGSRATLTLDSKEGRAAYRIRDAAGYNN